MQGYLRAWAPGAKQAHRRRPVLPQGTDKNGAGLAAQSEHGEGTTLKLKWVPAVGALGPQPMEDPPPKSDGHSTHATTSAHRGIARSPLAGS